MLALVLSDIHGRIENLKKIIPLIHNKRVCLALITGDITNYGGKSQTEEVLDLLEGIKTLALPGNLDTAEVLETLEGRKVSLHGKKERIGKWVFAGFGGGLLGGPGGFMRSEEEIAHALSRLVKGEESLVLATHLPPFETKLDLGYNGMHFGSRAVRKVIEKEGPALHLCGHIHEAAGEERIGKTLSINAGAVKDGKALLLSLGERITWERILV